MSLRPAPQPLKRALAVRPSTGLIRVDLYSAMIFDVLPLREKGWALPRFRLCMLRAVPACLRVSDSLDIHLARATRIAQLVEPGTGKELGIPPLYDAVLVCVRSDYMTISGIERFQDPLSERVIEYAQTWMLTPAGASLSPEDPPARQ